MKLQDAIKEIVAQFGESIVTEVRLANLLADINAYEEYPAMKQVLKESLKSGYGKKLFEVYKRNTQEVVYESNKFVNEFANGTNFKEDLISYGFDCIMFGLGCLPTVNEPFSKGFDPYSKSGGNILDNLADQLSYYQKQYMDLLDRLIKKPDDILRNAAGYYSAESLNKLYSVESKIFALQQQLGKTDFEWCKQQRNARLVYNQKQKSEAVRVALDTLKKEYQTILSSSLVIPKIMFIKRSGYYTEDTLNKLSSIETDIKLAYYNKGVKYDDWCERKKSKKLEKYKVEFSSIALQLLVKIGIPAAIFLIVSGAFLNYITSLDSIEQFERIIQSGDLTSSEGNYGKALQLFDEAKNSYNASFRPSHYQDIADEHINTNIEKAVTECTSLIELDKFNAASTLLKSLPQNIVEGNKANAAKVQSAQTTLDTAIANSMDELIDNISQNKGHLDAKSKTLLEELLVINPNDYWLNFIKNREK